MNFLGIFSLGSASTATVILFNIQVIFQLYLIDKPFERPFELL